METEDLIMELVREIRQDVKDTRADVAELKTEQARQNEALTHQGVELTDIKNQLEALRNKENPFIAFCRENGMIVWIGIFAVILTLLGVNIGPILQMLPAINHPNP